MITVNVNTAKPYDIFIGNNILESTITAFFQAKDIKKALIVTDDNVEKLYYENLSNLIAQCGVSVYKYVIIHGEKSKNTEEYLNIINYLCENSFNRTDILVALGGGVVGDLTGFCASTYLRGIKLMQLPTTLLSVIDSSVGGKTGVNLSGGKNLLGSFYQPDIVIADLILLESLPENQWQNGKGELIKYTLLSDSSLLELCENGIYENLKKIVCECVNFKRDIVTLDEKENGKRALLNLGHTLGHAIEKMSGFNILHGVAVAMGLRFMLDLAAEKGNISLDEHNRIYKLLNKENLLFPCPYELNDILDNITNDKKIKGDSITLVTIKKLKICRLESVPLQNIKEFFQHKTVNKDE